MEIVMPEDEDAGTLSHCAAVREKVKQPRGSIRGY
jgi:hypothetical protein